jgi:hypothetical protein
MKTIARIVVILLAALLVVGATVAFAQSSLASSVGLFGGRGPGQGEGFGRGEFEQGQRPARGQSDQNARGVEPRGDFERDGGINIMGIQPLVKNLVTMIGVIFVVAGIGYVAKKTRKRKTLSLVASPTSGDI